MHGLCNKPKPFYLAPLSMQCDNKYCINKCFNSLLIIQMLLQWLILLMKWRNLKHITEYSFFNNWWILTFIIRLSIYITMSFTKYYSMFDMLNIQTIQIVIQ
jgi:hypothetical protein